MSYHAHLYHSMPTVKRIPSTRWTVRLDGRDVSTHYVRAIALRVAEEIGGELVEQRLNGDYVWEDCEASYA